MQHEISVRVKSLRHLPQKFFHNEKERELALGRGHSRAHQQQHSRGGVNHRRCLRAQANVMNEARETGNSVWGKGMRTREATWLRGMDTLSWRLQEQQFKQVKAYTPVCKVHVYAVDATVPTMDTSDAVGWFVVDMRDLAGQRQRERWVKLQGASPAEVLISSSLALVQEEEELRRNVAADARATLSVISSGTLQAENEHSGSDSNHESRDNSLRADSAKEEPYTEESLRIHSSREETMESMGTRSPTSGNTSTRWVPDGAAALQKPVRARSAQGDEEDKAAVVLTTPAAAAVSELDALPVGPGADGVDAAIFSLSISVKSAAGLTGLSSSIVGREGQEEAPGYWFSYSIFGVVVQTDRFERLAPLSPGDGPVLEPMLDSFRLRATLKALCDFLGEAPPLQVYLCTEGRIIAHADVDMSRLLPADEWDGRAASQFGRTGMEGDYRLHRPGEPPPQHLDSHHHRSAVVTLGAELSRAHPDIASPRSDASERQFIGGKYDRKEGGGITTWSYPAPLSNSIVRDVGMIKATLQRLELKSTIGSWDGGMVGDHVLVGIEATAGDENGAPRAAAETLPEEGEGGMASAARGFQVVGCGEQGEVESEDSSLLETIMWEWRGHLGARDVGANIVGYGDGSTLAMVRVLAPRDGGRTTVLATGSVPWPSSAYSGRQHVNVTLVSPDGSEVGSCRVCLLLTASSNGDSDDQQGDAAAVVGGAMAGGRHTETGVEGGVERNAAKQAKESDTIFMEERGKYEEDHNFEDAEDLAESDVAPDRVPGTGGDKSDGGMKTSRTKAVQAEEMPLEGSRHAAGGKVPRSYRLSINLASVKDLDNAAYVVACYHYPHFGTSAPVRTALVWAAPRMDTPLANSCCVFSFGMSFDRLAATVTDRKLVVSLRNRDRFKEEEVGVVTIPLEDVVKAEPKYFRCRDTDKTFMSMRGFKAHIKSRQRAGEISFEDALRATPIEVKVLDAYLTVASTETVASASRGPPGQPTRLCSLRAILLLEDIGPTGDPDDQSFMQEEAQSSKARADDVRETSQPAQQAVPEFAPSSLHGGMRGTVEGMEGQVRGGERKGEVEAVWAEWEQWRIREEAAFAKRLREKDQALDDKWEARENIRRRDVSNAQTNYAKLESKLRKALSEVEARERQLKNKLHASRSDHANKLSEVQLLQRRLREETKHEVDLEKRKVKALKRQVASLSKGLEDARARVLATDEDMDRFRQQQRKTPEGGLRQEVFRLGAAKAEAEMQVEKERSLKNKALLEKEEYRAHIHKLARALKRHQERESTCARRQMEQLRLEYLAREERFMLDGDRNELKTIKQELDELRHVSLVQEAQAGLSKAKPQHNAVDQAVFAAAPLTSDLHNRKGAFRSMATFPDSGPLPSPPPLPTPAPPAPAQISARTRSQASNKGPSAAATFVSRASDSKESGRDNSARDAKSERDRLIEWRDELLGTGMYAPENPIVSELNRRIDLSGSGEDVPQEE